jgi:hypothetical protein
MSIRKHKYGAIRTIVDNITFPSKKEARRYGVLKLLQQAGEITNLQLQPRFDLHGPNGKRIGAYVGDFRYMVAKTGMDVVEDCKGVQTPIFKWKKKHLADEYGIEILVT